jgi:hypothetical protein
MTILYALKSYPQDPLPPGRRYTRGPCEVSKVAFRLPGVSGSPSPSVSLPRGPPWLPCPS